MSKGCTHCWDEAKHLTYTTRDDIAKITDAQAAANTQTFTYQNRQFLASRTGPGGTFGWTYNAVGNRASEVLAGVTSTYSYPALNNRLTSVSTGVHAFTYDGSGNVISDTQGANAWTYVYNTANRMESVSKNAVVQGTYVYNAMGQKVRRTAAGVTTNVVHDVQGRRIAEYNASGNTLIREYIWLGEKPLAVIEGGTVFYIRADNINRPVFATNASGVKVWTASYLPFGDVAASTGTPITLRFPGQWFELESGLHQNWMRDYDPTTGRYLQADPLGLVDGASVFGYAGQSPLRNVDPTGQSAEPHGDGSGNAIDSLPLECSADIIELCILVADPLEERLPFFPRRTCDYRCRDGNYITRTILGSDPCGLLIRRSGYINLSSGPSYPEPLRRGLELAEAVNLNTGFLDQ